eukprot:jgi/Psemu1/38842/gm1.38842_g
MNHHPSSFCVIYHRVYTKPPTTDKEERILKTELEVLDESFCSNCLGQFSSLEEKQNFWEKGKLIDIKHQIEGDIAYAELYRPEEESRTPLKIGQVVQNGSESDTDWESPPPSPVQGMDPGPITFTRSSNHFQYIQNNGSPANGKITN